MMMAQLQSYPWCLALFTPTFIFPSPQHLLQSTAPPRLGALSPRRALRYLIYYTTTLRLVSLNFANFRSPSFTDSSQRHRNPRRFVLCVSCRKTLLDRREDGADSIFREVLWWHLRVSVNLVLIASDFPSPRCPFLGVGIELYGWFCDRTGMWFFLQRSPNSFQRIGFSLRLVTIVHNSFSDWSIWSVCAVIGDAYEPDSIDWMNSSNDWKGDWPAIENSATSSYL